MARRINSEAQIAAMRESGKILASILAKLKAEIVPGMSGLDISEITKRELRGYGAESPFLGYQGFPDVICISVNDQVQHCIPSRTIIQPGDLINLDFGVKFKGMITDSGLTFVAGEDPSEDQLRLLEGTEAALLAAIKMVRNGARIKKISKKIESVLKDYKLGIVRDLVGHGVGVELHEEPEIPNYHIPGYDYTLRTGMTIAIEPITTLGSESLKFSDNGWDIYTTDGSLSAQFEHTILVLDDGCEVLTTRD
jgi:methionyl aminopeptidase